MNTPTKEQILKASKKSPEAQEVLEELFPEAFEPELFEFGISYPLDLESNSKPIIIGLGVAPRHLKYKCLLVDTRKFELNVDDFNQYKVLTFNKK